MDAELTAQELYRQLWHDLAGPALRELGFRGGGARPYFWYPAGHCRGIISFWKNRHSTRQQVDFSALVAAQHQPTNAVFWREGLDSLKPGRARPQWQEIHAGRPVEPVAEAVLAVIRDYAWPAIQAALDSPGYPPEPGKRWPREFPAEPEHDHDVAILRQLHQGAVSGESPVDQDLAQLAGPDARARARAAERVGTRGLADPRAVPALLVTLEHDPAPRARRNSAWVLAPAATASGDVRDALRAAAAEDEDVQVRWAARYSLRRADLTRTDTGGRATSRP